MPGNLFQTINDAIVTPLTVQMTAMVAPMAAEMRLVGFVAIAIAAIIWSFDAMHGTALKTIGRKLFVSAMMYSLLFAADYTTYVADLFLHVLPDTISAALGGGGGGPIAALGTLWDQITAVASTVYEALAWSPKSIALAIAVIAFVCVGGVCIGFLYLTMTIATVINLLALVIGPVFLAAATIPWTRRFASGWLSVLVGGVVTQVLSVALLQLMVGGVGTLIVQLATGVEATASNSILMLDGLGRVALLLWLMKEITKKIPEIAQVVGGGVYHGSQSAMNATFGMGSTAVSVAAGAVSGGVGGASAAIAGGGGASAATIGLVQGAASGAGRAAARGFRYSQPAGRSLSRRAAR